MERAIMRFSPFILSCCCLVLFSCGSVERCHERLSEASMLSDSLFRHGDSAAWHSVAEDVLVNANCVLEGSSVEADKLDAKVAKGITERRRSGWGCHSHVHRMIQFHGAIKVNADKMTDQQWEEVFATWRQMEEEFESDHRAAYCVEEDTERLLAMQIDFLSWRTLSSLDDAFEEVGNAVEDTIEEGLQILEGLFSE